jgi:hypothetical protein
MHGLPAASCLCGTYRGAGTLPKALAICQRLGKFPGRGRTKAINPLYDSNGVWKIQRNFDSIGPMPETEIENLSNRVNPVTIAAAPTNGTLETTEANGVSQPADKLRSDASTKGMPGSESPRYLAEALKDAERLLKYSAETGTTVEDDIRHYILQARAADNGSGWDKEIAANLLMALTKLAARVKPVTAESVKWCENTRPAVRTYFLVAICLAFFIVPFSVVSFVATAISTAIRNDIVNGNDLAVKLRVQFPPPSSATQAGASTSSLTSASGSDTSAQSSSEKSGDERDKAALSEEITELQLFASNIRAIDARARQLTRPRYIRNSNCPKGCLILPRPPMIESTFIRTYDILPRIFSTTSRFTMARLRPAFSQFCMPCLGRALISCVRLKSKFAPGRSYLLRLMWPVF